MSAPTDEKKKDEALKKVEEMDIGALVLTGVTNFVKQRPVGVSMWVVGLLLAAFANGFQVDDMTRESYMITLKMAEDVDRNELDKAMRHLKEAEDRHYKLKGWFWTCDDRCAKAKDKADMARSDMMRVQKKRDQIMTDARREVGIWSTFGVQDVRDSFWKAWKAGKDMAARYTMMDAMFMAIGGSSREESAMSMVLKLVMQYIINLTMGLVGAFFFFMYSVYSLVCSYGETASSGLAFFLLVLVAGMATIGTYLGAIYSTVVGGGVYLVKQAAKHAALEAERNPGGRRRQVQYGGGDRFGAQGGMGGRPGGMGGGYGGGTAGGMGQRRTHGD